ncbi:hypothetical protein TIFTF001_000218 [Ficus carica]|uniref:Uncharacterized protein n=1 Tax=Ficus carica TaxID=3494 RepID=A0AA88CNR4_FICCA|nr:hypothetical protein TIFTF001_000218 [Ficus carica]
MFVHCCLGIMAQFPPILRERALLALTMWRGIREEIATKSMDLSPTLGHKSGRSLTRSCRRSSKSPSHLLVWRSSRRRKSTLARTQLHR